VIYALISLSTPLLISLFLLLVGAGAPHGSRISLAKRWDGCLVVAGSLFSLLMAWFALLEASVSSVTEYARIGGWEEPLGIRLQLTPLIALLLMFTALVQALVALYGTLSRHGVPRDFWPLSSLMHAALAALWLSADLFNLYVTLELLGLAAVALVSLAGPRSWKPAMNYLLLSLAASLCYLLGVALIYGRYGMLDIAMLTPTVVDDTVTRLALLLMTAGLMLKAALWPLHLWLPPAHANAPTAVSALLSALVVKAPLFIIFTLWSQVAPPELAQRVGPVFALAGIMALISGGLSAMRTPYLKVLVAYSTVAQLGYALMALGLLLAWQHPQMNSALWLFVIAHGLAKTSLFLAAGEMQTTLGTRRISGLRGATQTVPVAMFAFAVAGGSLIGLPPSGGFLAKWVLLEPLLSQPQNWPWAIGILLGTLVSAAYIFRIMALSFDRARINYPDLKPDKIGQWVALLPALLVWIMALAGDVLLRLLEGEDL
jgi:multicomponent Na+:H+ antiporter subunit D